MKFFLIVLVITFLNGCSTLSPTELPPNELQNQIINGEIIHIGDDVKIVTVDGKQHEFKVTTVANGHVTGKGEDVLISDIIAIETENFSGGKTALLVGGVSAVWMLSLFISFVTFF